MSKQFLGIIAAILIVFIGIFIINGNKSDSGKSSNGSALSQHVTGKGTSGVTFTEYGDYQCPVCGEYYPLIKQVVEKYGDQIKFQFRNFPLTSIHQNAFAGARAAEAAAKQNKFWEMNSLLFETQSQWSAASDPSSFFEQFAKQLGLNVDQFKKDYGSTAVNDTINADMAEGTKLGITGTPTFFINGVKIESSPKNVEGFTKLIDAQIAKQAANTNSTTTPAKQ